MYTKARHQINSTKVYNSYNYQHHKTIVIASLILIDDSDSVASSDCTSNKSDCTVVIALDFMVGLVAIVIMAAAEVVVAEGGVVSVLTVVAVNTRW